MKAEWLRACRAEGMTPNGDYVLVPVGQEGQHRIAVLEEDQTIRLTGIILRRAEAEQVEDLVERVLDRNRSVRLVGYRLDDRGRLVGEAVLPKVGLEGDELVFRIRHLAADCNRFEYVLAGRDEE